MCSINTKFLMETNREKYFTGFSREANVSMFVRTTTAYCVNRSHHRRQNFDSHETIAFLIKQKHITCGKCQGFEVKIRLHTFRAEIRQRLSQQKHTIFQSHIRNQMRGWSNWLTATSLKTDFVRTTTPGVPGVWVTWSAVRMIRARKVDTLVIPFFRLFACSAG